MPSAGILQGDALPPVRKHSFLQEGMNFPACVGEAPVENNVTIRTLPDIHRGGIKTQVFEVNTARLLLDQKRQSIFGGFWKSWPMTQPMFSLQGWPQVGFSPHIPEAWPNAPRRSCGKDPQNLPQISQKTRSKGPERQLAKMTSSNCPKHLHSLGRYALSLVTKSCQQSQPRSPQPGRASWDW